MQILLISGGVAVGIILVAMIVSLSNRRPKAKNDAFSVDDEYRRTRIRRRANNRLLWFVLLGWIATGIIGAAAYDWSLYQFRMEWPIAIANITQSDARQNLTESGTAVRVDYTVTVQYQYQVTDDVYNGTLDITTDSQSERNRLVERYPQGGQLVVWHHPIASNVHFTYAFGGLYNIVIIAIGAVFGLLALWALFNGIAIFRRQ